MHETRLVRFSLTLRLPNAFFPPVDNYRPHLSSIGPTVCSAPVSLRFQGLPAKQLYRRFTIICWRLASQFRSVCWTVPHEMSVNKNHVCPLVDHFTIPITDALRSRLLPRLARIMRHLQFARYWVYRLRPFATSVSPVPSYRATCAKSGHGNHPTSAVLNRLTDVGSILTHLSNYMCYLLLAPLLWENNDSRLQHYWVTTRQLIYFQVYMNEITGYNWLG